jgi:ferredoxin--NADP+ reductase
MIRILPKTDYRESITSRYLFSTMTIVLASFLLLLAATRDSHAFVVTSKATASSSFLSASPSPERVSKAGGGISFVPTGDRLLFDPGVEGMLGDTDDLNTRLKSGVDYQGNLVVSPPDDASVMPAQAWLEDIGIPAAFAKPTSPVMATVLGRIKLIEDTAPGDIEHVVLRLPTGFHYVEGQSLSVIPPGVDSKTGKKQKPRLYSIASTRYGDLMDGNTVSLCVRRAEYYDPVSGLVDPTKEGACSKFLCDAQPGMQVQVAGPVGKTMVLPEDPTTDIIMVATGTGIAPFRGFLHRLFMEETIARHAFQGCAWLILGVPTTGGLLYPQEFAAMHRNDLAGDKLEITYAISREMTNQKGGKLYVQDVLQQNSDKLFERLEGGANIYFCGLKGMMPGILEALEQVAVSRGIVWSDKLKEYKDNHQWHVEVY